MSFNKLQDLNRSATAAFIEAEKFAGTLIGRVKRREYEKRNAEFQQAFRQFKAGFVPENVITSRGKEIVKVVLYDK